MHLRKLRAEDAPAMLAWMHDRSVVAEMGTDFASKTMDDCLRFIKSSEKTGENLHLAVADDEDHYMGTVSLKHIDRENRCAEFAITVCAQAMGKGFSRFAMERILEYGFRELGLERIYWYVSRKNTRAIRFYDKNGYRRLTEVPEEFSAGMKTERKNAMLWYLAEKE